MKLRNKTNKEICNENKLPYTILTNVVEETNSKNKMRATSDLIAKALTATLGPYGSSTIIQDRMQNHFATKDGYDLMNRISFQDEVAKTILDLFRTTASNQVLTVGDGSTSAIVVANALFQALTDPDQIEHFKKIAPKDIIDVLNDLSEKLEIELKKIAIPVSEDMHELDTIATIANNNDHDAGKVIADIYRKVGPDGFITMDVLDRREKDDYEIKNGIEWARGYLDPIYGMNCDNGKVIYENNVRVILSNSTITYDDLQIVVSTLLQTALNQENAQLVFVANDFDQDALNFFNANRTKHMRIDGKKSVPMNFTIVDIDQVTSEGRNRLKDLATLAGCKIYDKLLTQPADIVAHPSDYVGKIAKAVITPKTTQLIGYDIDQLSPEHRKTMERKVDELKKELKKLMSVENPGKDEDLKIYEIRKRISNLTSSSAILHVGGKTQAERMTRQRLIEDAVFACKSTLKYGFIPGGNIMIPKVLEEKKEEFADFLGEKYSYLPIENLRVFFLYFIEILKDAFLESYRAVLNNSYMSEEEVESTITRCLLNSEFYNLKLHEFEKMNETLVINSVDTDIQILRSCISIIGILSTSNQFITLNFDVDGQIENK